MSVDSSLSLYVHFPWCVKKCPYCDFNSHTLTKELPETEYIQILINQLIQNLPSIADREIKTIFLGGGTPSLFSGAGIGQLLTFIKEQLPLAKHAEITLEANPGTVEQSRFQAYREAGVNRISLGVQSFDDQQLKKLGRIHGADEAKKAIAAVVAAGFDNFNIDIMYGLPEQTVQQSIVDLETALSFCPPHLSWYQLTLEPQTFFYKFPPSMPDDDHLCDIEQAGRHLLATHGLKRYEISAYTRQAPCFHNINYWQYGDYLGIGAGAHGKLTDAKTQTITRTSCYKHPKQYMNASLGHYQQIDIIPDEDIVFEYMLNALRLVEGTMVSTFAENTFKTLEDIDLPLAQALERQLIHPYTERLQATPKGLQFLNDLTLLFLPTR